MKQRLFISSVQKELATERRALKAWLLNDALLSRFFAVFLFEDLPAADHRADEVYLEEVSRCDLYLGLFGDDYGREDGDGLSPTHREFQAVTRQHKPRLIFVKGADDSAKHPKMRALIGEAGSQLLRRRFSSTAELIAAVYASLVQYLGETGVLQSLPFDERLHADTTLADVDPEAVGRFIRAARHERQLALAESATVPEALTHLNLLRDQRPTHGAILLFGRDPQRFFPAVEIRCMHFHGTTIQRPAPFYRIFKGILFSLVDQAVDFVLSKLNYSVGTRAESAQAPGEYELPPAVIREAIVNAVAHRDYTQPAAIQVSVFADRLEVRNPGSLLPPLTPASLHHPHASLTRNHRLCEALYLARYIEKYSTGTLMMIEATTAHALPEPDFQVSPGEFVITLWRDWLTAEVVAGMKLSSRQLAVLPSLKLHRRITNAEYQRLTGTIARTAARDLEDLVSQGVLQTSSKTGRGTAFILASKPDINPTNRTLGKLDKNKTNRTTPPVTPPVGVRQVTGQVTGQVIGQVIGQVEGWIVIALRHCETAPRTSREIQVITTFRHRETFQRNYLDQLLTDGLLERTLPSKPTSRLQRYRLTGKGRALLESSQNPQP